MLTNYESNVDRLHQKEQGYHYPIGHTLYTITNPVTYPLPLTPAIR